MKIAPEKIQQYKDLHKKHFGEDLTDKEALEQIQTLLVITELGIKKAPP